MTHQPRKRNGQFDRSRRRAQINVRSVNDGLPSVATHELAEQVNHVLLTREKTFGTDSEMFDDLISGQASTQDVIEVMGSKYASTEVRCACAVYPDSRVVDMALNDEDYAVRVTALLDNPLCSVDTPGIDPETMFMAICTLEASQTK